VFVTIIIPEFCIVPIISILSPLLSFNFEYSSSLKFIICASILYVPSVIDPHPIFLFNFVLNIVAKFVLIYVSKTVKNYEKYYYISNYNYNYKL